MDKTEDISKFPQKKSNKTSNGAMKKRSKRLFRVFVGDEVSYPVIFWGNYFETNSFNKDLVIKQPGFNGT